MRRQRSHRIAALAMLAVVVMSACVKRPQSGVSLKALTADLVFGIPPVAEPATPSNFGDTLVEEGLGVISVGSKKPKFDPTPEPQGGDCPEAPSTSFPEAATTSVASVPLVGGYRWVVSGSEEVSGIGTVGKGPYTQRSVSDVRKIGPQSFEFTVQEAELRFGSSTVVKNFYRVAQDGDETLEDGIYLIKVVRELPSGAKNTFLPTPPVQILPLPVGVGADGNPVPSGGEIDSVGVDQTFGKLEVLRHRGTVLPRQRIDACGEIIDSWFVDGDQEFTSTKGDSYTRNYDYNVATQLGGLIIAEKIESPTVSPKLFLTSRIGQATPD